MLLFTLVFLARRGHGLRLTAAALAVTLVGCVGVVGDGTEGSDRSGGKDGDEKHWDEDPDPETCDIAASPAAMRLLTRAEYENTVSALVGTRLSVARLLPLDAELKKESPFASNAGVPMDETRLKAFEIAAEDAADAVAGNLASHLECEPGNITGACAESFVRTFARLAYRRPVTDAEVASLTGLYNAVAADGPKSDALRFVVEAVLQSPQFLYHVEVGIRDGATDGRVPLTEYEVASRLAFFLTGEGPDGALLDAAAAGELATAEGVAARARTLLESDKARGHAVSSLTRWLRVDGIREREKSPAVFANFGPDVRAAALAETQDFFRSEIFEKSTGIGDWFTTKRSYFGGALNALYGATANRDGDTAWGDAPRAGLLGQASWLAAIAGPDSNIPTKRGKFVVEDLLCHSVPPPPAEAMLSPVAPPNSVNTTRERFEEHGKNGCTVGCHDSMDPIGFAFEHFNAVGAFQSTENGKPIDASGTIDVDGVEGAFTNGAELSATVAASDKLGECFASRWFELAMARELEGPDYCSVAKVGRGFVEAGGDYRELLIGIVTSEAFRTRELCEP